LPKLSLRSPGIDGVGARKHCALPTIRKPALSPSLSTSSGATDDALYFFIFAYAAGLLTIASPCIFPILPFVLGRAED
jgi:thiol:disulfide interchange protein